VLEQAPNRNGTGAAWFRRGGNAKLPRTFPPGHPAARREARHLYGESMNTPARLPSRNLPRLRPLAACLISVLCVHATSVDAGPAAAPRGGVDRVVDNCDDAGAGSLRAVVAAAASGDVVDLGGLDCAGISLTSGAIVSSVADLTITGPAQDGFVIDGNGSDRVFAHHGTGTFSVAGLTLANGHAADSGGCILAAGNLLLDRVSMTGCTAGGADVEGATGGAAAVSGNAQLIASHFIDNTLDGTLLVRGGALSVVGNLVASDSSFSGNRAHSHAPNGGGTGNIVEGGAVRVLGEATLAGSTISGNTAFSDSYEVFGGGLTVGGRGYGEASTALEITASTISGNVAESGCDVCAPQGGGVWANGISRLVDVVVSDNRVASTNHYGGGGGLRFSGSGVSVEIQDCTISGNQADSAGGGIIGPGQGVLSIARTRIVGNSAGNEGGTNEGGGGILGFGSALQLVDSSVTGNSAGADGGGVALLFGDYAPAQSVVINSTVSGNTAYEGGGLFLDGSDIQFSNSTIAFNNASSRGAGISADSYTYSIGLQSTIVAGNLTGAEANNLWAFPETVSGANNLVPNAGGPAEMPGDTITLDPLLLPLAENGGPTLTHALAEGSPAIDAGNNAIGIVFDQRGANFMREHGAAADIGAFELQPAPDVIFADGFED
jgi:hypothetical protein